MSVGVRPPRSEIDRPVLVLVLAAVAVAAVGAVFLVQAALGGRPSYRTVRVDNRAALPLQVDVAGADGGRLGQELAGRDWTVQVPEAATAELERQGYR